MTWEQFFGHWSILPPTVLRCTVAHRGRGKAGARYQKQSLDGTGLCAEFVLVELERDRKEALNLEAMRLNALLFSFMIHQISNIHFCLSAFRSDVSGEITKTSKSEQIFVMFSLLRAERGRVYTDAKTAAELLNRKRFLTLSRLPTCTTQCVCVCVCVRCWLHYSVSPHKPGCYFWSCIMWVNTLAPGKQQLNIPLRMGV